MSQGSLRRSPAVVGGEEGAIVEEDLSPPSSRVDKDFLVEGGLNCQVGSFFLWFVIW